ncbi:glycosyltransferase family 8 protein [Candidatus Saccharibacteria bacterium]|nr:glycosyltransferase family 8 protein [Candidatus Saccharibacteria bacterium]
MNILYCGDEGISRGVLVSILSIMMNGEKHTSDFKNHTIANNRGEKNHTSFRPNYTFYIATIEYKDVKPFKKETAEFLDGLVKKYNPQNSVKLIDATKVFVDNLPSKNMGSYFTPCSMLRLYADKMPELSKLDRILYLDYDVVCRANFEDFYNMDMAGVEVAGVLDIYGKHFYRYHGIFKGKNDASRSLPKNEQSKWILKQDYMNSGVMLFNMPECIKSRMFEKAVKKCGERWMMLADQSALNKVIERRKLVPRKYNEQGERPRKDTVLHHFSNNFKFWPYFRVQKVKPFEVKKIHEVLKIHEYDDILNMYNNLESKL